VDRPDSDAPKGGEWLARFHAGERSALEELYRDHVAGLHQAVGKILDGANRETVVHEVFFRLMTNETMRRGFDGASIGGWLRTVARNHAIDFHRRLARETGESEEPTERSPSPIADRVEAKLLIERFKRDVLPAKWAGVFEARFIRELDQREAARSLGISRTTLAYQEMRVRSLLRGFLLNDEGGSQ
jgi:RNA polymerase sigma-70 factor (ECF subfamily)